MSTDHFPSKTFMRRYFGLNLPLIGRMDTGWFSISRYAEIRRSIRFVLIFGPKHLMSSHDWTCSGVSEIVVFRNWKLHDTTDISHIRASFLERIGPILTEAFERELYDEMVQQIQNNHLITKDWWEWFIDNGTIGIRLKEGLTPGGNEPKRNIDADFNI